MAQVEKYEVKKISGLRHDDRRRGLAFLKCKTDESIDANPAYEKLKQKQKDDLFNRYDYWMDGGTFDKYFHGWPNNPDYKFCFVFKLKIAGTHHRWYGFLINPKPLTDRGYLVCVLASHAQKNTEHTDPSELDAVNKLRLDQEVVKAVKKEFPE